MIDVIIENKKVYLSQNYSGFCLDVSCLTNSDLNDILNVLQEDFLGESHTHIPTLIDD